jgi:hypothetical protein
LNLSEARQTFNYVNLQKRSVLTAVQDTDNEAFLEFIRVRNTVIDLHYSSTGVIYYNRIARRPKMWPFVPAILWSAPVLTVSVRFVTVQHATV